MDTGAPVPPPMTTTRRRSSRATTGCARSAANAAVAEGSWENADGQPWSLPYRPAAAPERAEASAPSASDRSRCAMLTR